MRSTARPPKATAVRFRFQTPAMTQPVTMTAKATATIHSSRLRGPIERSASRAAAGASGVSVTPGGYNRYRTQGSRAIEISAGTRRGDEPRAEVDLQAVLRHHRHADRVGRGGGEPEDRGDGEARHPAEHQVAAQPARALVLGLGAGVLREGQDDGKEHAAACRVAGKRRCDHGVGDEDAVAQSQRRLAEQAHHAEADAPSQAALHDAVGDEEGHDHEQHARVREAREGLGGVDRAGEDRGRRPPASRRSGAGRRSG